MTNNIRNIKGMVNSKPPKKFSHLKHNPKRIEMNRERQKGIYRQNSQLLSRMVEIDGRKDKNRMKRSASKGSLNRNYKVKELMKIASANRTILSRLSKSQSCYDIKKWENEHIYKRYLKEQRSTNSRNGKRITDYSIEAEKSSNLVTAQNSRPTSAYLQGRKRPQTAQTADSWLGPRPWSANK